MIKTVLDQIGPCGEIEIIYDDYIPIRVRFPIYSSGVSYIRQGNFTTSLCELRVDEESGILCGITLLSFNQIHATQECPSLPILQGLPKVDVRATGALVGPEGSKRIDLLDEFSVAAGPGFLEICLNPDSQSAYLYECREFRIYCDTGGYICKIRVNTSDADRILYSFAKK